jgi:hypothetical protein
MDLIKFKGILYGKLDNQFFIWDSSWETFRPVEKIAWNGSKVIVIDSKYKSDIFDPYYGFGSREMNLKCLNLSQTTDLEIPENTDIKWLTEEWWRDRRCNFSPCAEKDVTSWRRYLKYTNAKHRTIRIHTKNRATKRLISN